MKSARGCLVLLFVLSSCELSQDKGFFEQAQKLSQEKKYEKAIDTYEKVVKGFPRSRYAVPAAQEASHLLIQQSKNYLKAVEFLNAIVVMSSESDTLLSAQKQLAEVYFEKLANYHQSIIEYNKLLTLPHSQLEGYGYRLNLGKANFFTGNFAQALSELEEAFKSAETNEEKFQTLVLKGNVLMANHKSDEAIRVLNTLFQEYPELAQKENVGLTLAVNLEEKGDLKGAVAILEKIKSTYPVPEFIKMKIQRLEERMDQLPGAQGVKK